MTGPSDARSPWFPFVVRSARPRSRLICFAHAGGNAAVFRTWRNRLGDDIEVWSVQLPGRTGRFGERPFVRVGPLVEALLPQIEPLMDLPCTFFGHSMGALVAFEVARALDRVGQTGPRRVIASGFQAPHLDTRQPLPHDLPEPEFLDRLRLLKGTPPGVFEDPELRALVLPTLRADLELVFTYQAPMPEPLRCGFSAFAGDKDEDAPAELMREWERFSRPGGFRMRVFEGDHFYLFAHEAEVVAAVRAEIEADA